VTLQPPRVHGYCPACGHDDLWLSENGLIVCNDLGCPNPTAAVEILDDAETEHIVWIRVYTFTVRHPLRERIGDSLLACPLDEHIRASDGPPYSLGRYRVTSDRLGSNWTWSFLPETTDDTSKETTHAQTHS